MPAAVIANLQPEVQAAVRNQAQQYANATYQRLLLKLDELERVCELNDAQKTKLKVAAKGAVDHSLTKWLAANASRLSANAGGVVEVQVAEQQAMQNQIQARRDQLLAQKQQAQLAQRAMERQAAAVAAKAATPAEQKVRLAEREALDRQQKALLAQQQALEQQIAQLEQNAAAMQAQAVQQVWVDAQPQPAGVLGGIVRMAGGRAAPVAAAIPSSDQSAAAEQEKTWTAALEFTLTDEQKDRMKTAAAERSAFQPKTAAERVMKEIDQRLLLDRAQREKLTPIVAKTIEQQSVEGQLDRNPNLAAAIANNVLRALPDVQLKAILSESQRAQRLRSLARPTATPTGFYQVPAEGAMFLEGVAPPAVVR